jgi:hypothetical protein
MDHWVYNATLAGPYIKQLLPGYVNKLVLVVLALQQPMHAGVSFPGRPIGLQEPIAYMHWLIHLEQQLLNFYPTAIANVCDD